jgi:hypothetical protein
MKTPEDPQPLSPEELADVRETIYNVMITWAEDKRRCACCGGNITDKQMKSIAYWETNPARRRWAVSHGLGECAGAAPPSSQAFGHAGVMKAELTEEQAARAKEIAKAIAQAAALMAMAMEVQAS